MENKFYQKDSMLTVVPYVSAALWIATILSIILLGGEEYAGWVGYSGYYYFGILTTIILMFVLKYSYKTHTKNVMKGIIGALCVSLIFIPASNIFYHLIYAAEYEEYYGFSFTISSVCDVIIFICMVMFTINHFVIQADHHSSPQKVVLNERLNIIIVVAAVIGFISGEVSTIAEGMPVAVIDTLGSLLYYGLFVGVFLSILHVERKLDYFRLLREGEEE